MVSPTDRDVLEHLSKMEQDGIVLLPDLTLLHYIVSHTDEARRDLLTTTEIDIFEDENSRYLFYGSQIRFRTCYSMIAAMCHSHLRVDVDTAQERPVGFKACGRNIDSYFPNEGLKLFTLKP